MLAYRESMFCGVVAKHMQSPELLFAEEEAMAQNQQQVAGAPSHSESDDGNMSNSIYTDALESESEA
eukprot:scaffold3586_cov404-Prasinococcus_capsulatus_cf.AAC.25